MPKRKSKSSPPAFEISDRVALQAKLKPYERESGAPMVRPLRIYTLDPSVSNQVGGVATVNVPYEKLTPGPIGGLFEIDGSGAPPPLQAHPLDLDDPRYLLTDGLTPSPENGQFHLQMTYAVCSLTYAAFRRALGRDIAWAVPPKAGEPLRLVVRPFAFQGKNAGYSREMGDLSFGWFRAGSKPAGLVVPKGLISTALSHDIIAHEVTHALLDGLRSEFHTPTNVDVPAFHEGFADLVALFLHFSYADVVERAIRDGNGVIGRGSLLTELAREFGYARSRRGREAPLRSAIDLNGILAFDSDALPNETNPPRTYDQSLDSHTLGSVLVSAVFEAFTTIVRRKTERFYRIAGIDPLRGSDAPLSEQLLRAIAEEASSVAARFLDICIRAIDYCPPADMELGEYLRALITADGDMEHTDKWGFRQALMRSFRRREIFPDHVQFMCEAAVRWDRPKSPLRIPALSFQHMSFTGDPGQPASANELARQANALGTFVTDPKHAEAFHLIVKGAPLPKSLQQASPPLVQSVRVARRATPDGRILFDIVAEVTQSCTVLRNNEFFDITGGATIIIDPEGLIRYIIYKRPTSTNRQSRQQSALHGPLKSLWKKTSRHYHPRKNPCENPRKAMK